MKLLCVDDDTRSREEYCSMYNLDEGSVIYASNLNDALEIIETRCQEFDTAILDINIPIIDSRYKEYLKEIVTEKQLENGESTYGGFYLYLMLLHMGFLNNRIAFLSGYLDTYEGNDAFELFIELKEILQKSVNGAPLYSENVSELEVATAHILQSNPLKLYETEVRRMTKAIKARDYSAAINMVNLAIDKYHPSIDGSVEGDIRNKSISKTFSAFDQAGISVPDERKFKKLINQYLPDDDRKKTTDLKKWLHQLDPNRYYMLRANMIEACIALKDLCHKKLQENQEINEKYKTKISEILKQNSKFINYKVKSEIAATIKSRNTEVLSNTKDLLSFYEYMMPKYQYNRRVYLTEEMDLISFCNEYKLDSKVLRELASIRIDERVNERQETYDLSYFIDTLSSIQEFLPVREPQEAIKQQLYRQLLRFLSSPWEGANPKYPVRVYSRKELMDNCIGLTSKLLRNWISHSRIDDLAEEDMACLFVILIRSYFNTPIKGEEVWEENLLKISYKCEENQRAKQWVPNQGNMNEILTKSLYDISNSQFHTRHTINIDEIMRAMGNRRTCDVDYLYKMFWHTMYYPFMDLQRGHMKISFNRKYNAIYDDCGEKDIITQLYASTFAKAFKKEIPPVPGT